MNQPRMARCASLLQPWFDELVDEDFRRNATRYLQSGTHSATIAGHMDNLALTAKLFLNAQENRLPRITTIQVM